MGNKTVYHFGDNDTSTSNKPVLKEPNYCVIRSRHWADRTPQSGREASAQRFALLAGGRAWTKLREQDSA
jgi:hypothetical protein